MIIHTRLRNFPTVCHLRYLFNKCQLSHSAGASLLLEKYRIIINSSDNGTQRLLLLFIRKFWYYIYLVALVRTDWWVNYCKSPCSIGSISYIREFPLSAARWRVRRSQGLMGNLLQTAAFDKCFASRVPFSLIFLENTLPFISFVTISASTSTCVLNGAWTLRKCTN